MGRMKAIFNVKDPEAFVARWVNKFLSQFQSPFLNAEDLRQEGLLILVEAASLFSPEKGSFSNYAGNSIQRRFVRLLQDEKVRLRGRGDRSAGAAKLLSLDEPSFDDSSGASYHEVIGSEDPGFDRVEKRQLHAAVKRQLEKLPTRTQHMVNEWLHDVEGPEIGSQFGIGRERVRQVLKDALEKTKKRVEAAIR